MFRKNKKIDWIIGINSKNIIMKYSFYSVILNKNAKNNKKVCFLGYFY